MSSLRFAFIDIETTGSRSTHDRITEVAIKIWQDGQIQNSWQSLIDPEVSIPPFIQSLTGIHDELVRGAPVFRDVAETIDHYTEGCIFVAHNARFDYGFLKAEFRRLNISWSRKVLCTVKLSRRLYPGFKRHGLDALIERHQLHVEARHRAMADVDLMLQFFECAKSQVSEQAFQAAISEQLKLASLPKGLSLDQVKVIPSTPGVYRFFGENNTLLYVGKSVNLYQRVMSHFSSDHLSTKEMTIAQSVVDINWTETAGDLGAQLLELQEIKTLHPIYNRRSRASKTLVSLKMESNSDDFLSVSLVRNLDTSALADHYGVYRSVQAAKKALSEIANKNQLCRKLLGLEKTQGACFGVQMHTCNGACLGEEDRVRYNLRMQIAFHALKLKVWPYKSWLGIREVHPERDWIQTHLVYNWCYLGSVSNQSDLDRILEEGATNASFDLDTYKLLTKAILGPERKFTLTEIDHHGQESSDADGI